MMLEYMLEICWSAVKIPEILGKYSKAVVISGVG